MRKIGKKVVSLILALVLCLGLMPVSAFAEQAQIKNGFIAPIESPDASAIKISTPEELASISSNMYGSYVLTNDIDMTNYGNWMPIGVTLGNAFRGSFDGQGHKISGLTVSSNFTSSTLSPVPPYSVGLFGVCDGAQIKNLEIENANISVNNSSGYQYEATKVLGVYVFAGSIAGYATNKTVVYNCHNSSGAIAAQASGEAQSRTHAGGLIGYAESVLVSYSYNKAYVNTSYQSGMFGNNSYAGGLVGYCSLETTIGCSYNSGTVLASVGDYTDAFTGGLVGGVTESADVQIEDSFNEGKIETKTGASLFGGENAYAGGIAGAFSGTINRVYNCGVVSAKVNDSWGIASGSAYAGGVCGKGTDGTSISNSVSIQSQLVAEKGSSGTRYQYQISCGGNKNNNISTSSVVSETQKDADISRSGDELKLITTYRNELGWDFSSTWAMLSGKDYPQIKQIDINSDEYESKYIADHLDFISGNSYSNILENYRWAQIYWSEENNFRSNAGEFLYKSIDGLIDIATLDFKGLFDDDNPYKIILLDYISDQTVQNDILEIYKVSVPYSLDKNLQKAEKFVKDNWNSDWGKLDDKDLFWLFRYSDKPSEGWITENFEDHIDEIIFGLRDDTNNWAKVFNIADETWNSVVTAKQKYYDKTIDWINGFIEYSANVDAYIAANQEFQRILERMCENFPTETNGDRANKNKLEKAIKEYTQYNGKDDIKLSLFLDYAQETVGNKIEDYLIKKFKNAVEDWIKNTFSATALSTLETIGWAADVTWKICEYVTSNGALMDCRQMLRSNAYFEATMYNTLREIELDFVNSPTIENARLFDAAFRFFKETQIYSMDTVITYFDTYQTAWLPAIQNLSNTFMNSAIEQVQVNKMTLYKTYCHGVSYLLGGKVITIACPTNVYLYNESHTPVVAIENSAVTFCEPEICAYTTDNIKIIVVPLDTEYTIDILGTDDGNMDYSISEYDATLKNVQMVVYSDLALSSNTQYHGLVSNKLGEHPSSYNLIDNAGQIEAHYKLITVENNVPPTTVAITGDKTCINVGDMLQLSASITPQNATVQSLVWTSSNPKVATVSEEGKILGLSEGSTNIIVQSIYGGISDTFSITVKNGTMLYNLNIANGIGEGKYAAGAQVFITANDAPMGKVFDKWVSSGGSFADATSIKTIFTMPAENAIIEAIYKDILGQPDSSVHSISFDPGGGVVSVTNMTTGTDGKLTTLPMPTRSGYTFDGWFTSASGGSKITTDYVFTSNTTVYAHWAEDSPVTYTITFDAGSGTVTPGTATTGEDGKLSTLPVPTRSGYTFDGWFTSASGGSKITTDYVFTSDTTVYAHWIKDSGGSSGGGSSGGGSSGGGSSSASYSITAGTYDHGSVNVSPSSAKKGDTVTITAAPDAGYELVSLTVADKDDKSIKLVDKGNGKYTFIMPEGKVTVNAKFDAIQEWKNPFTDILAGQWYYDAVKFVNQNGLMNGIGNNLFAPQSNLSRAQLAQILYNKGGKPAVTDNSSFSDVSAGQWYTSAVIWANKQGIVGGYGNGLFGPNDDITREQLAVMLWRYVGKPGASGMTLNFTDADKVSSWALDAMRWATENGIVNGKGNGILDPGGKATRAETAQMLKNFLEK